MNDKELINEIAADMDDLLDKYHLESKISESYLKERKKKKIRPTSVYPVVREITSNRNNKWLVIISKRHNRAKYKNRDDYQYKSFAYYFSKRGMRVLNWHDDVLRIFNSHFFARYNERLRLGIPIMLDVVKHFVLKADQFVLKYKPTSETTSDVTGITTEGFLLGEAKRDINCIVFKTFVSMDNASYNKQIIEKDFHVLLRSNLKAAKAANFSSEYQNLKALCLSLGILDKIETSTNDILTPDIKRKYDSLTLGFGVPNYVQKSKSQQR